MIRILRSTQCIAKTRPVLNPVLVRTIPGGGYRGKIVFGARRIDCALGASGFSHRKREGDGATPTGVFRVKSAFFRADRMARPISGLTLRPIHARDGWCDDPSSFCYNRPVRLPFPRGHERLCRSDALYDVVITLDHNQRPRVRGHGSAIFIHIAGPGYTPTAGCVALSLPDMRRLLPLISRRTVWVFG